MIHVGLLGSQRRPTGQSDPATVHNGRLLLEYNLYSHNLAHDAVLQQHCRTPKSTAAPNDIQLRQRAAAAGLKTDSAFFRAACIPCTSDCSSSSNKRSSAATSRSTCKHTGAHKVWMLKGQQSCHSGCNTSSLAGWCADYTHILSRTMQEMVPAMHRSLWCWHYKAAIIELPKYMHWSL